MKRNIAQKTVEPEIDEQNTKPKTADTPTTIQLDELAELDIKIAELETRLRRSRRNIRTLLLIWNAIVLISGLVAGLFRQDLFDSYSMPTTGVIVAITLGASLGLSLYFYLFLESVNAPRQREYEQLSSRRRVLASLSPNRLENQHDKEASYFDKLVQINVTNLAEYYSLVKTHTDNSYKASIVAGLVGFALIVAGVIIGFTKNPDTQMIAYISAIAGVITEFISGVFFYLYNRTVRQLKEYHDSLIDVQNVLLSFKIVGDMSDEKDKVKMVSEMLKFLIGNESKRKD